MTPLEYLKKRTQLNAFFYPHSRSHLLKHYSFPQSNVFIKREDELGGICNGSKIRKYYSLIPALNQQNIRWILLKGGAYSNALAALVPLLIEHSIQPFLFLRGEPSAALQGNLLYLRLFVNPQSIHWISRQDWPQVDQTMQYFFENNASEEKGFILPEGACCKEALLGALTLAMDIITNQQELNTVFDHIFIEAGTGGTAIALILGLKYLNAPAKIHVLTLTKEQSMFKDRLYQFYQHFCTLIDCQFSYEEINNYIIYAPEIVSSFGVVNQRIVQTILNFTHNEGILLDPIYAAPLFIEAPLYIHQHNLKGNFLFIHNGGNLSTLGYSQKFFSL